MPSFLAAHVLQTLNKLASRGWSRLMEGGEEECEFRAWQNTLLTTGEKIKAEEAGEIVSQSWKLSELIEKWQKFP